MNDDAIATRLAGGRMNEDSDGAGRHERPEQPKAALDRLLRERHSCRAFVPDRVDRATIESIFTMAQQTASWCNSQPWQVTIASGDAIERFRAALVDAASVALSGGVSGSASNSKSGIGDGSDFPFPAAYTGVYLDRRRECGFRLYDAVGVARGDRAAYARQALENFRLFGAPHVAILTSDSGLGVYGAIDVGGYAQILLLAMQAHGVAAIPQAAIAGYSTLVKSLLNIPPERMMVCGISFGYEDTAHRANRYRTSRAKLDDVITWVE